MDETDASHGRFAAHQSDWAQSTAKANGKAERFIRTMLAGWAYGAIYRDSHERTRALDGWLWHYNHQRRHSALGHHPPITRVTNLLGTYS
jgi:transposase InsO family protein